MKHIPWRPILLATTLFASTSCESENEPTAVPEPGTLVVTMSTPATDDGAILLSISGGGMSAPTGTGSSYSVYHRSTGVSSMNVAVVGNLGDGPILRFDVPDLRQASSYIATVHEVADRGHGLRQILTDYRLDVVPQGGSP